MVQTLYRSPFFRVDSIQVFRRYLSLSFKINKEDKLAVNSNLIVNMCNSTYAHIRTVWPKENGTHVNDTPVDPNE